MTVQKSLTSLEALTKLKEGNTRYVNGLRSIHSLASATERMRLVENGQRPFAIILTCSDSRVPAEIVFDQGLGDLFVVRVAGNVIAPSLLASIEFAASTFETSLCLVMGHTHCGAVQATINYAKTGKSLPSPHLEELVGRILPSVDPIYRQNPEEKNDVLLKAATEMHVKHTSELIMGQSAILRKLAENNAFTIGGGVYDLESGKVNFL